MVSNRDMFYAMELAYQANDAFDKGPEGQPMFEGLTNLTGMYLGPDVEGTAQMYARPEAEEVEAVLESRYGERLRFRHKHTKWMAKTAIEEAKLLPSYELPQIESFLAAAARLQPSYEKMEARGWDPELVMLPRLLTLGQWNDLLTDHPDESEEGRTAGLERDFPEGSRGFSPPDPRLPLSNWDLAVMSTKLAGVASPTGECDPHDVELSKSLGQLVDAPNDMSPKEIIRAVSPSLNTYLAYQWSQVFGSEIPLDTGTETTLIKEGIFGGQAFSTAQIIGNWSLKHGTLHLGAVPIDLQRGQEVSTGIRPTVETTLAPYL